MEFVDLIIKKRDGLELSEGEISFIVKGASDGSLPDYQLSAFLMAVVLRGMSENETAALTLSMAHSGDMVDLSTFAHTVDKHSTGGVGDKTSLIIGPIAAACGCTVAKMSGRGLGHTGGTIDKLESVPGVTTELSSDAFRRQAQEVGLVIAGQSGNLAPADKKLYALRDVTGTVQSLPLIVSSIMSKKLAAGSQSIVLDVKTGSGAFMKTPEDSMRLAQAMVKIGRACGRNMSAVISDMSIPLGNKIGNGLEIAEAMEVLSGKGPEDLRTLCLVLAGEMIALSHGISKEQGYEKAKWALDGGYAAEKFSAFLKAQGAVADPLERSDILPKAKHQIPVYAEREGYITSLDALTCGNVSLRLGAGRRKKSDIIDPAAGIELYCKPGDYVQKGQPLALLHSNMEAEGAWLLPAFTFGETKPAPSELIYHASF